MLINRFPCTLSEMYYCTMAGELIEVNANQMILEDNREYSYTIKPFETTNSLGAVVATLEVHSITNLAGEKYKLYKTTQGNWYDIPETNNAVDKATIMSLKFAINSRENKGLQ